ncbi:hypothetical protein BAUCODRAFT_180723 [Baudoinia panamericana UAMH 10762]|uniref:Uncharacterized protein n=1 Tax=Baudoinia panamericana (strain UAMH 10762) TaxID=717646 RepID=M2M114_BAUPA|nr:uncharacterized protein BAUCODRAFT_180723 [Baudoinia panamericana UAMH 10762]EMD00723.1 hypothetical protein BAUCODRAFT_180723 [Baudoinia panamericana UAMH 10762]
MSKQPCPNIRVVDRSSRERDILRFVSEPARVANQEAKLYACTCGLRTALVEGNGYRSQNEVNVGKPELCCTVGCEFAAQPVRSTSCTNRTKVNIVGWTRQHWKVLVTLKQ